MAQKTKAQLIALSNSTFPDNTTGLIKSAEHRAFNNDMLDSVLFPVDLTSRAEVLTGEIYNGKPVYAVFVDSDNGIIRDEFGSGIWELLYSAFLPNLSGLGIPNTAVIIGLDHSVSYFTHGNYSTPLVTFANDSNYAEIQNRIEVVIRKDYPGLDIYVEQDNGDIFIQARIKYVK